MYSKKQNLVIGFHGCDESVLYNLLNHKSEMFRSQNDYDWLGPGMYFWQENLLRAHQWAQDNRRQPAVLGALIDLGECLDFVDSDYIKLLLPAYKTLKAEVKTAGTMMPKNTLSPDRKLRKLDCAVIKKIHEHREWTAQSPYDTVRGVFWEGKKVYPTSGFKEKNHIQICVYNPNSIKALFIPRVKTIDWRIP